MADPSEAVTLANSRFYRALASADLDLMASLWPPAGEASCVHPGWPRLEGWESPIADHISCLTFFTAETAESAENLYDLCALCVLCG